MFIFYQQLRMMIQCSRFVKECFQNFYWVCFSHADRIREAVQASGPVDPTGCLQVAEKALSKSASDLQRLFQTARHHRYILAPEQWLPLRIISRCRSKHFLKLTLLFTLCFKLSSRFIYIYSFLKHAAILMDCITL